MDRVDATPSKKAPVPGADAISSKALVRELLWDIFTPFAEPEMDTNTVYIAPRFCTRCCREWGDLDVLFDIRARRTNKARAEVWSEALQEFLKYVPERGSQPNARIRGPCCTTNAIAPQQHNLCDFWKHSIHLTNSNIGGAGSQPSALFVTARRQALQPHLATSTATATASNEDSVLPSLLTEQPSAEMISSIFS